MKKREIPRKMPAKRRRRLVLALLLLCASLLHLPGCTSEVQATNLTEEIPPREITPLSQLETQSEKASEFAVRLLQTSVENGNVGDGKNILLSPLSVLCALSMTACGAEGETLSQMETTLGMPLEELNLFLYSYLQALPQTDSARLHLANSLWLSDDGRFTPKKDFLQTVTDYYGADVYKSAFDEGTCRDINRYVKRETDGMIPEILDAIPPEAVLYLVNALAFEAEWPDPYQKNQVWEGIFTSEDGSEEKVDFLHSEEDRYLETEQATGFMKLYKGGEYAFAALLPKEGVKLSELIQSLRGDSLHRLLANPEFISVSASIPKFETSYSTELSDTLAKMGMPLAFDPDSAEFGGLGDTNDGPIFINRVLHKTFLSLGEKGTRAGAATVVEANGGRAEDSESKEVFLDRPFVYLLVDCKNALPFFLGTMNEIGG